MTGLAVDTHALIWYVQNNAKLSVVAKQAIEETLARDEPIWISSISMVEIIYLIDRGKLPGDLASRVLQYFQGPNATFSMSSLSLDVALAVQKIPRQQVPDMLDRIIAATALALDVPLVSKDRKIQASAIQTIW